MEKVLFWDFYGTLTYPNKIWSVNVWKTAQENLGRHRLELRDVVEFLDNDGFPWHHPERDYTGITEPYRWWAYVEELFVHTYARCGISEKEARMLSSLVRREVIAPANYRLYEDVLPYLEKFRNLGFRNVILSNNFPELSDIVSALGLDAVTDGCVTSALVGYEKPRTEIFRHALRLAGYPEQYVMIGDSPSSDIAGGKKAGFITVLLRTAADCGADYRCAGMRELFEIFSRGYLRGQDDPRTI